MNKSYTKILAIVLIIFGLLTLFLTSSIIFDWFGIREKEGNYVLFIVWANFICSWIYLFSGYGILKQKRWSVKLLIIAGLILISTLLGLFIHINAGLEYETKTIGAMFFRITVTFIFAYFAHRKITD